MTGRLLGLGLGPHEVEALAASPAASGSGLLPVHAPFAGTVLERSLSLGAQALPGDRLILLRDTSRVWVLTTIHEREVAAVLEVKARGPVEADVVVPALEGLLVPAPNGSRVPLGEIASVKVVKGPMQVSREKGMRRVVVEANVRGRDLGRFAADAKAALAPLEAGMPTGTFLELGGRFENQRRAMRQLGEQGLGPREAVIEGCRVRLKPLVMTALTSFIGHLPMLFATGSGADIQRPLAVIVMGGIVTSTLLTLLVLPVLYEALERRSGGGTLPTREQGGGHVETTTRRPHCCAS